MKKQAMNKYDFIPSGHQIQLISAPSILGLKPTGVETMSQSLVDSGLAEKLKANRPVVHVDTFNKLYSFDRDENNCLNSDPIREFSLKLSEILLEALSGGYFPLVLGGDCSILIAIMHALKKYGNYGLVYLDAHADFYAPEKSVSGEVADMALRIVTGRGPDILANINNLGPYVKEEQVVHIGQRDWRETVEYGSEDIRETGIKCYGIEAIEEHGISNVVEGAIHYLQSLNLDGFWVHYDTDVLSDNINPAVDYRIPGGLQFGEVETVIKSLCQKGKVMGIDVTIFNPKLDTTGEISGNITQSLGRAFNL